MRALEAELEVAVARYLDHRGDYQASLEQRRRALALAESLGDWHLLAKLHISLGAAHYALRRFEEAAQEYEQGIHIARRTGNLRMLAFGLFNVAGVYLRSEDYARGEPALTEAGSLFQKLGDPVSGALVLQYEGLLWSQRGKWGLGKAKLVDSVARLRRASSPVDLVRTLYAFSWEAHLHGERATAVQLIDEAIVTGRKLRMRGLVEEMEKYRLLYDHPAGSMGKPEDFVTGGPASTGG
jgi:tetratricopeptide (TPR) repeat protein